MMYTFIEEESDKVEPMSSQHIVTACMINSTVRMYTQPLYNDSNHM